MSTPRTNSSQPFNSPDFSSSPDGNKSELDEKVDKILKKHSFEASDVVTISQYLHIVDRDSKVETIKKIDALVHNKNFIEVSNPARIERLQVQCWRLNTSEAKVDLNRLFSHPENKKIAAQWQKANLPSDALLYNPEEARFITSCQIQHASKYYGDEIKYDETTRTIRIKIDGKYQEVTPFVEKLEVIHTKLHKKISQSEIVSKDAPLEKWCYLPTKGLCQWTSDVTARLEPCGKLEPEQVQAAQRLATLQGKGEGEKNYVLEIVSSYVAPEKKSLIGSGIQETIFAPKHPWIRMITPDGDFYCVGFGIGKPFQQYGEVTEGMFRTPDSWETQKCSERLITGIKISEEQFKNIKNKVEQKSTCESNTEYQLFENNCVAFLGEVFKEVNVQNSQGEDISPKLMTPVDSILYRMFPKIFHKPIEKAKKVQNEVTKEVSPPILLKIWKVIKNLNRLMFHNILRLCLRNLQDISFEQRFGKTEKKIPKGDFLTEWNQKLKARQLNVLLPVMLQEWQRKQKDATRIYTGDENLFKNQYASHSP